MTTSLIETLELPDFDHTNASRNNEFFWWRHGHKF